MATIPRRRFLQASAALATAVAAHPVGAGLASGDSKGPKFRLGLVTYNLARDWDLPTLLRVCRNVGLAAVELRTTHKHGVEPDLSQDQRQAVRKRFADAGIEIWGPGSTCEFHSPDATVVRRNVELCKEFVRLAADLGARGVKVRPNGLPREVPVAKTLEQIGKALVPCGQAAADAGVEIWVEVHGSGTSLAPNMKTILEHCGHPQVGIAWNSNGSDLVKGSVAESFRILRPWLKSCHINDLYRDMTGAYPYRELFRLMRETGYDRVTLCEVGRAIPDPGSAEEFLRYYKALWRELARG
jgi:sugar phosphate isomerase/epimerase